MLSVIGLEGNGTRIVEVAEAVGAAEPDHLRVAERQLGLKELLLHSS